MSNLFWVNDARDIISCWDSTTGTISRTTRYDPAYPDRGTDTRFGMLTALGDGRLLTRLDSGPEDDKTMALVIDADFSDLASADVWHQDITLAGDASGPQFGGGLYDTTTGLNWLHWYDKRTSEADDSPSWGGFTNAGALVETAGFYPTPFVLGDGQGFSYVEQDGFWYRGVDFTTLERYRHADGTFERTQFSNAAAFLGFTPTGDFVLATLDDDPPSLLIYPASSVAWTTSVADIAVSDAAAATSTYPMMPTGSGYSTLAFEGRFGNNVVLVSGGFAYYSVARVDYGIDGAGMFTGNVGEMWQLDLANGDLALLFAMPYLGVNADGSTVTDSNDPNFATTTTGYAFGLLGGPFAVTPSPYVPPVRSTPSLRMLQRGGSGGMSGIPRMIGDPTRRGSVRQGPGSVY